MCDVAGLSLWNRTGCHADACALNRHIACANAHPVASDSDHHTCAADRHIRTADGDDGNPTTNRSLRQLFQESIFTGKVVVDFDDYMALAVHPATWKARLPELIPTHEAEKVTSYHYRCREVNFDWRAHLPEGHTVHRIDSTLLGRSDIAISDTILKWAPIEKRWGTVENFTSKGLGFCVAYDGQAISWCVADCASGDRMTVSIVTLRAHQRRGLAAVAAAATAECALSHGFSAAEWHCDYDNIGSWKTAERVGFERQREYTYYYYIFHPIDQLAQLGERAFLRKEYVSPRSTMIEPSRCGRTIRVIAITLLPPPEPP